MLRCHRVSVCSLIVLLAFHALSAGEHEIEPALLMEQDGGSTTLRFGESPPFHRTGNRIAGLHLVQVPDSVERLVLWNEALPSGGSAEYYGISLDGRTIARVRETSYELRLAHGKFDPARGVPPVEPSLRSRADSELHLVQFVTQPLEAFRNGITAVGGKIHGYVADHAYVVRMDAQTRREVEALPYVRWVGPYQPAYKLERFLRQHLDDEVLLPALRYNVSLFEKGQGPKAAVADRIRTLGGVVDTPDAGVYLLEATLTPEQLREVVRLDEVHFVDRWGPYERDMDLVRGVGGADYIESVGGYTGTGVSGEVLDAGFNLEHCDFGNSLTVHGDAPNLDSHGAATSGILFGRGSCDADARGLLPDGQGIVAVWPNVSTGPNRYTHTAELLQAPYLAVFHSASVGTFPRTTDYTTISKDMDAMLFDLDLLHFQSQSNKGHTSVPQDSRAQAWAKNIVSVGGIRHDNTPETSDDCWDCGSTSASIGPASDGRIKPDLAHFYDLVHTTECCGYDDYQEFGGTSAATPITAGHGGLLFEMWHDGLFGNPVGNTVFESRPHMSTAKAMLIHSAAQWDFCGAGHDLTRVHQGWGRADVGRIYDLRDELQILVDETDVIGPLATSSYSVTVDAEDTVLRATLVYTDPEGDPAVQEQHRINDLTLKVTSPAGEVYWGNHGLDVWNWSASGGGPNHLDTVENVFVQLPQSGNWTVEIIADEINEDGHVETPEMDADYALVVSASVESAAGGTQDCSGNGVPDLCEPDCNGNGVADDCDTLSGFSEDCDGDLTPDECEEDCNFNGIPNDCEATGLDCNGNGVPDECDTDCNANGVPDDCESLTVLRLHVDSRASGANDGTSWEDAFVDLQDALTPLCAGEVWVATGTYTPDRGTGLRSDSFRLLEGFSIYGGFAGGETELDQRDPVANPTVLSGDLAGDDGTSFENYEENSYHVVTADGTVQTAVLDGFTITGGRADQATTEDKRGAGMDIDGGSPTLNGITFLRNWSAGAGGGLYSQTGNPVLTACSFVENRSFPEGFSSVAGGMFNGSGGDPVLTDCVFLGNTARLGGGLFNGGFTSDLELINALFSGNSASLGGGGIYNGGTLIVTNGTIAGNSTPTTGPDECFCCAGNAGGGGIRNNGVMIMRNSILSGNSNQLTSDWFLSTNDVQYSLVQDSICFGGTNLTSDPVFLDADGSDGIAGTEDDDLRVRFDSPVIDVGTNDVVAVGTDLDGNARIDDGNGFGGAIVDMGAYELAFTDCNQNGRHDQQELFYGIATDCNGNGVPDECDIAGRASHDCNSNHIPDDCELDDASFMVTGAVSRRFHGGAVGDQDIEIDIEGRVQNGNISTETRENGVEELRITGVLADLPPFTLFPIKRRILVEEQKCPGGSPSDYQPIEVTMQQRLVGNELILSFTPSLGKATTYRLVGMGGLGEICQSIEVRALTGDVNGDGFVNGIDVFLAQGLVDAGGFSAQADINLDGVVDAADVARVEVLAAGQANCAP